MRGPTVGRAPAMVRPARRLLQGRATATTIRLVPQHYESAEARWLEDNYFTLVERYGQAIRDQWIAVVGHDIVDIDSDAEALALRVTQERGEGSALFARVVADRIG